MGRKGREEEEKEKGGEEDGGEREGGGCVMALGDGRPWHALGLNISKTVADRS